MANLSVAVENLSASESRVRDTDMAEEMVSFTRHQIMVQAGTAMLAQANQVPSTVLVTPPVTKTNQTTISERAAANRPSLFHVKGPGHDYMLARTDCSQRVNCDGIVPTGSQ